jgi:hypothetical protein
VKQSFSFFLILIETVLVKKLKDHTGDLSESLQVAEHTGTPVFTGISFHMTTLQ